MAIKDSEDLFCIKGEILILYLPGAVIFRMILSLFIKSGPCIYGLGTVDPDHGFFIVLLNAYCFNR